MSKAHIHLVLTDEYHSSAAAQAACITAPDGTVVKQAANVATTGTVEDVVNALVAAGIMAAPAE